MSMDTDSDFSYGEGAGSYGDGSEFEEERGSFTSVIEIERVRRDPFAGVKVSDWYAKRQSAKRQSAKRQSAKRHSAQREFGSSVSTRQHQATKQRRAQKLHSRLRGADEELSVKDDMGLVVVTVGLSILSIYHLVNTLTPHQISVILGYGLVGLGATSKLPYVISLERSKTAVGISDFKQYSDIMSISFAILFNVHRNYPFLAWGEKAFLLAQNLYVTNLMWTFRKVHVRTQTIASALYAVALVLMFYGIKIIDAQYRFVIPLIKLMLSKPGQFQQVYLNFENRHTGPQSGTSQVMISLLKFLRLYTTITEIGDPILILSAFIAFGLNVALLFQIIAYRENTARVLLQERRESERV